MASTHFEITRGAALEHWCGDLLRMPGGSGEIREFDTRDPHIVKANLDATDPPFKASKRWQRAQSAEAAFWKSWRENTLYAHISLAAFWESILQKTGGPIPKGRILDIGCGPVSVLNFHRPEDAFAIGLDPLARVYLGENIIESAPDLDPIPIIGLPAERLPFGADTFDHLICFNVLDHVSNAPAVLAEMWRVLKPGGTARLYVHTFQSWIKRWLFFDRPHVYHWDHPEFRDLLREAGFVVTHGLREPKTFDLPPGLFSKLRHFPYWVATKVGYTSYFCVKKPDAT